jgi:hypothetical protein
MIRIHTCKFTHTNSYEIVQSYDFILKMSKIKRREPNGYSVGPKYEFVLIDKGIVERVAVTFSGHRQ